MSKKILSIILCIVITLCSMPVVFAQSTDAELYQVYADGMLFGQNKDAILSGTATVGTVIKAELFNSESTLVANGEAVADADGKFNVSFVAPKGSYEEYTIVLSADGTEFDKLENVVFGELWLASGQSNMQYSLNQTPTGSQMKNENKKLSKWLRVLKVPYAPENMNLPVNPLDDIGGTEWVNGEDSGIYTMSAVAYFFAEELMKELDMPVGILNANLGATTIRSWLSREAIESNPDTLITLTNGKKFVVRESEKEIIHSIHTFYQSIQILGHTEFAGGKDEEE